MESERRRSPFDDAFPDLRLPHADGGDRPGDDSGSASTMTARPGRRSPPATASENLEQAMKYMMIMRTTDEALEASKSMPFEEILNAMGRYNESMIEAGVMLGGEGLTDPEEGFVVDFGSDPPQVTSGAYAETAALFNGFWLIQVGSADEAAEWAKRCPLGPGSKLEMRRIHEDEDFPQDNEYVQKEKEWRQRLGTDKPVSAD
jgi:hypothetical protein